MMKQIDNYSQIVSWAKLWFHGSEKKVCRREEKESRSKRHDAVRQEQQVVFRLTFQKFRLFKMPSIRHLIQIQNIWKRLNQPTTKMDHLLHIQHKKKKSTSSPPAKKRKSFASSTIVYTLIQHNQNHDLIQILPIQQQLLIHKQEQSIVDDDDDNIPLGNLIK